MKIQAPKEVFIVALENEGLEFWETHEMTPEEQYKFQASQRGWTEGGLEQAISDFLFKRGEFSESGRFEDVADGGYSITTDDGERPDIARLFNRDLEN